MTQALKTFYERRYKRLMIIPIVLVLLGIFALTHYALKTGDIMAKDISLKGGITATIYHDTFPDIGGLETALLEHFTEVHVRTITEFGSNQPLGVVIEADTTDEQALKDIVEQTLGILLTPENSSIEITGSTLGNAFYKQMLSALFFAFLFMGIVVFFTFKSFIPSIATIFAAFSDILLTLVTTNYIGITISGAGIAALLLLIGYSIDTDILLTTRVLKRKEGTIFERFYSTISTGLTMTVTTFVALLVGYIFSSSLVFKEMFSIIMIGLFFDVIMTYLFNAPMIIMYTAKKEGAQL